MIPHRSTVLGALRLALLLSLALPLAPAAQVGAQATPNGRGSTQQPRHLRQITNADRKAAAQRVAKARQAVKSARTAGTSTATTLIPTPGGTPDYFGPYPNYANSPILASVGISGDGAGALATATVDPTTGAIMDITVTNGGADYTTATVSIIGGGGSGATAAATIANGAITGITVTNGGSGYNSTPGLRKFVDSLPGLTAAGANDLGQYIPVAIPDTTTYPGSDYYEIALVQYTEQMHQDLPATTLRGYVQLETSVIQGNHVALMYPDGITPIVDASGNQVYAVDRPQYLGPVVVAQKDRPVRVKFTNFLPTGVGGDLFIPVDTTVMGAGDGPQLTGPLASIMVTAGGSGYTSAPAVTVTPVDGNGSGAAATATVQNGIVTGVTLTSAGSGYTSIPTVSFSGGGGTGAAAMAMPVYKQYTQNRATLHLHGGNTPWISDGTPHQWTTPAGENTAYPEGVSVQNVPDMPDPGPGSLTFFYTNQQSARLMFYHDHAYGITRLNVYAGEAAGYLLRDAAEQGLIDGGVIPSGADEIPLVIQDKTFVPSASQLAAEDPTWDTVKYGGYGNLWFPHVYMPNQDPHDLSGASAMGRWDYGPWFWPPYTGLLHGPVPNPYYDPVNAPWEPPNIPGTPNPSLVPEGFMDTPLVNGTAYPYLTVEPKPYRFRILNAANDRTWNLQLYQAVSDKPMWNPDGTLSDANAGEVAMVPAVANTPGTTGYPKDITDGRDGGVPDVRTVGPSMMQIGTEGGFLPGMVTLPNTPVGYNYNRRDIVALNVSTKNLFLGPAERADVIVDFSQFAGKTLILYNDAPAPVPAFDPRYDYYTGDPDQTAMGGAPSTLPGYGPNTRTVMQIQVATTVSYPTTAPNLSQLPTALPPAYAQFQDRPIVPQAPYNTAFNAHYPVDAYARIQDTSLTFADGSPLALTLLTGGSGYTTAPAVTFSGGGGTGATATTTLAPTGVGSFSLTAGGSGYTSAPAVNLTGGGGSGAVGTATLSGTAVGGLTLGSGGSGYTSAPGITFTPVDGNGSGAAGTVMLKPAAVASLALGSGGSGYTSVPTVSFSGGGGSGAAGTVTLQATSVAGFTVTSGGSGYTTAPSVSISGGGGSGATANVVLATRSVASISVTNVGTGYTSAPTVSFSGGGGTGAAATANWGKPVSKLTLKAGGKGYKSAPTVTISAPQAPGGVTATAVATINKNGVVTSLTLTNPGSGYTSTPTVSFSGGGGSGASATATLASTGAVVSVTVNNGGTGYTSAPTVNFSGGGGFGAAATATLTTAAVASISVTNPGSGYTSVPTVSFSGGGGSGAVATANLTPTSVGSISLTQGGSGYTSPPAVTITPVDGNGSGATASTALAPAAVASITLSAGGTGYTAAPAVVITPVDGNGSGAAATATLVPTAVGSITLSSPGAGYSSAPTVSFSGGGGSGAAATATLAPTAVGSITLINPGTGYTSAPAVTIADPPSGGTTATATTSLLAGVVNVTLPLQPKAIQELFTTDYGRMNATLGVEVPNSSATTQTTIPYAYVDPSTEILKAGDAAAAVGSATDGTQIWKITHNGVDTHAIHFHLFNVQLINRVGWDGAIRPPDANELGWKDTVRMNPLEDAIVALRPLAQNLPWQLPNSVRPLDVTMPLGTSTQFTGIDPSSAPAAVTNQLVNFGWEYVWHCHLLGHEENDMMRPMILAVAPLAPTGVGATASGGTVTLTWSDASLNATGFTVQRATAADGPWTTVGTVAASTLTYQDMTAVVGTAYYYQVIANNVVGYTQTYPTPAIGYPSMSADSAPVIAGPVTP